MTKRLPTFGSVFARWRKLPRGQKDLMQFPVGMWWKARYIPWDVGRAVESDYEATPTRAMLAVLNKVETKRG
jgi:hypothetical protein